MQKTQLPQPPRPSSGVIAGTLLWTEHGPRPVEAVQPCTTLIGFNPDTFTRQPATVRHIQIHRAESYWQLLAGGRLLTVPSSQPFTTFDLNGNCTAHPVRALQPGMWIPVDRHIPLPSAPITLPDMDEELSTLVGEDALAMTDAIYSPKDYFSEMGKRGLRLKLLELTGYLLGAATLLGDDIAIEDDEAEVVAYYRRILDYTFGRAGDTSPRALSHRLRRWMGSGLAQPSNRAVPAWAFDLENQGRTVLLRGFFDAKGNVTTQQITVQSSNPALLAGIQALLGATAIEATIQPTEATGASYQLTIRNVRRFAEWVHSNATHKAALLRMVYAREPRYPTDGTARLPLNVIRPALERIRASHSLPQRLATAERVDEREVSTVETLRLLSTAFHDEPLRDLLNQQLFLEPITLVEEVPRGETFEITLSGSSHLIANGIILGTASV